MTEQSGGAGRGGSGAGWAIGLLLLVGAAVAWWFLLGPGASEAAPSPTPTATATVTASPTPTAASPSPSPSETVAGGTGTRDDPYWIGIDFLFDGPDVDGTDASWNVAVASAGPAASWGNHTQCWIIAGTMTPGAWPTEPEAPEWDAVPTVWAEWADVDGGNASTTGPHVDTDGLCDTSGLEGHIDIGLREGDVPASVFDFMVVIEQFYAFTAPEEPIAIELVTVGNEERPDGTPADQIFVKATGQ